MKVFTMYSDTYKCSTSICWKKGCLEILGISFPEGDGISIDVVIKEVSELSGVEESKVRKLLRKLTRRSGNYYTTLMDLKDFIREIENEGERKKELIMARAALVSNII